MEMRTTPHDAATDRDVDAAVGLMQLALDDVAQVERLLAELADELARQSVELAPDIGAASAAEAVALRAQHIARVNALMVAGAQQLAAIGNATRTRFSRLLTERLASGRGDLLDAYQAFFKVLPSQNAAAVEAMRHALARGDDALEDALEAFRPPACTAAQPPFDWPHVPPAPSSTAAPP